MVWDIFVTTLKIFWRRMGVLLLANILWLGLSLLIVPWPAATVGLFYLVRRVVAEELENDPDAATLRDFWVGVRRYWQRGSIIAVLDLLAAVVIGTALVFYWQSDVEMLRWLVGPILLIGIAWAGTQLYLFPLLLQREEQPPLAVAREAFLMAISYPLVTYSLLLTLGVISMAVVILAGPILLVFFAFVAVLQTVLLRDTRIRRGEIIVPHEQRRRR
ncbi:MAG TPA: DUF624 domain-containing protein [Roseiflexaceae bacterium]|nr:DUF624 domain-containing protein [Roseiflexaceae bacterium]HMP42067.1 DUF624 domain-containing protein [Roseiflexaceae bacterium]